MGGFGTGDYPDIEGDGPKPGEPPARPANDFDADGLTDDFERTGIGTDWRKADTDGDGLTDWEEHLGSSDPLRADTDGDRLNDLEEQKFGTNPRVGDSDGDGIGDYDDEMVLQPTYNTGPSPFGSPPISAEEAAFRAQAGKGVDPFQVLPGSTTGASGGFIQMFPTPAHAAPDAAPAALAENAAATEDAAVTEGSEATEDGAAADGAAGDVREFDLEARLHDLDLRFGAGRAADGGGDDGGDAGPHGLDGDSLREDVIARVRERLTADDGPLRHVEGADRAVHEVDEVELKTADDEGGGPDRGDAEDDGEGPQGIRAPDPGEEDSGLVY